MQQPLIEKIRIIRDGQLIAEWDMKIFYIFDLVELLKYRMLILSQLNLR